MPKARFKPTLPEKSGLDGEEAYLGQLLHLYSPYVNMVLKLITMKRKEGQLSLESSLS